MKKRLSILALLLLLLLPQVLFAQDVEEAGAGDSPKFILDDPGAAITPNPIMDLNVISDSGFASFRTDEAKTLDKYINTTIEFDIIVDAEVKDMTNTFLILSVYDIDGGAKKPEVDKVYLNDHYLGNLTGNNNAWSFSTFPVNSDWLKGSDNSDDSANRIRIEVDSLKSSTFWMLCDWGAIKTNLGFQVVSISPYRKSVRSNQHEIMIKFNEEVDKESLKDNIFLKYKDFNEIKKVTCKIIYQGSNNIVKLLPHDILQYGVEYTVTVNKKVKNSKGAFLKSQKSASFVPLPTLRK